MQYNTIQYGIVTSPTPSTCTNYAYGGGTRQHQTRPETTLGCRVKQLNTVIKIANTLIEKM